MGTQVIESDNVGRANRTQKASAPGVGRAEKKVLLIAFDFPPRRTSGVYRPAALVRYLPRFGWVPTVLTIRDPKAAEDRSLLAKIPPEVSVVRTPFLRLNGWEDVVYSWARSLGAFRGNSADPVVAETMVRSGTTDPPPENHPSKLDAWMRLVAAAVRSALYFPDESVGWIPAALAKALKLTMAERFDAVYTTHPPRAAHVIGLLLKTICGVPWVAEFRDPWVVPEDDQSISQIPARRRNQWLQGVMLQRADALVTVTSRHASELKQVFRAPEERVAVVSNGFDEEDFRGHDAGESSFYEPGCIHLSHFGTVYRNFSGKFFEAAAQLIREQPHLRCVLRIHVIGYPDEDVRRYAAGELQGVVLWHTLVPHEQALRAMYAADGLLLFYGHKYTSRVSVPGKLYEYLRIGRPVLAVAYDGGVQELIRRTEAGWVIAPDDVAGARQALEALIIGKERGEVLPSARAEVVAEFRYDRLAEQLALVLDGAIAR